VKIAVAQITSSNQPDENLGCVLNLMEKSAGQDILFLPEVTNCVSFDRKHQMQVLKPFESHPFIAAVAQKACLLDLWVALGSVSIKTNDPNGRFANRSVLINAQGETVAHYDKIHMFDVQLSSEETYHESKGFRAGQDAVLAQTPWGLMGLTICYDLRFPHLYRALAQAGARILTIPAAFSPLTGKAHWHSLLRARAIETGCYVVASAQTGTHPGTGRKTFGHGLVVDPWGEIILDAGDATGLHFVELDLDAVDRARSRVASLQHDRIYKLRSYPVNDTSS